MGYHRFVAPPKLTAVINAILGPNGPRALRKYQDLEDDMTDVTDLRTHVSEINTRCRKIIEEINERVEDLHNLKYELGRGTEAFEMVMKTIETALDDTCKSRTGRHAAAIEAMSLAHKCRGIVIPLCGVIGPMIVVQNTSYQAIPASIEEFLRNPAIGGEAEKAALNQTTTYVRTLRKMDPNIIRELEPEAVARVAESSKLTSNPVVILKRIPSQHNDQIQPLAHSSPSQSSISSLSSSFHSSSDPSYRPSSSSSRSSESLSSLEISSEMSGSSNSFVCNSSTSSSASLHSDKSSSSASSNHTSQSNSHEASRTASSNRSLSSPETAIPSSFTVPQSFNHAIIPPVVPNSSQSSNIVPSISSTTAGPAGVIGSLSADPVALTNPIAFDLDPCGSSTDIHANDNAIPPPPIPPPVPSNPIFPENSIDPRSQNYPETLDLNMTFGEMLDTIIPAYVPPTEEGTGVTTFSPPPSPLRDIKVCGKRKIKEERSVNRTQKIGRENEQEEKGKEKVVEVVDLSD